MSTPRLNIIPIQNAEIQDILRLYNVHENMQYILTGKSDYTLNEVQEKWQALQFNSDTQTGFKVVKLKSTNEIIGECGLLPTDKPLSEELEIAYMIDKAYWRQGFGKEICEYLIDHAFNTLNTRRLLAGMYKDNKNSIALVEKLGFKLCHEGVSPSGIHFKEFELTNPY